jgi:hypothetical protein
MSSDNDESDAYRIIRESPMVFTEPPKQNVPTIVEDAKNLQSPRKFIIPKWFNDRLEILLAYIKFD